MLNPTTVQSDMLYAISETGKDVRHIRYTYATGNIYGNPTSTTLAVNEVIKVSWSRADRNLKILELGNYDIGDVRAICDNTVNIQTDDMLYEDSPDSSTYSARYKTIRVESANIGGIRVYQRAILKKVV